MKKFLAVMGIVALVLAGCSAPAVEEETMTNTVSNEINDTSIYFSRVEDEANYLNFFEAWARDDNYSNYATGVSSLYGMSTNETNNVYTNVANTQFVYSPSNGHTYKIDMEKVKADFAVEGLKVVAIDGATLYLLNATTDASIPAETTSQTSLGVNPVVIISNPIAIINSLAVNGTLYFATYTQDGTAEIHKISKEGQLYDYGTAVTYKATEGKIENSVNIISVENKIYVQASSKLFEINGETMTELDFGMSEGGFLVSNLLGYNGHMYGVRAVWNQEYFKDFTKPRLSRIYLVEWDAEFNVLAEYDLPDNYGTTHSEFSVDLTYNISQGDSGLQLLEKVGMYKAMGIEGSKDATFFYNHTFNLESKELKNDTKFETSEAGKIIK